MIHLVIFSICTLDSCLSSHASSQKCSHTCVNIVVSGEGGIVDICSRTVLQEGNTTLGSAIYPDYLIFDSSSAILSFSFSQLRRAQQNTLVL